MSDILCVHYYALIPFCDSALPFADQGLRGVLRSLPYLPDNPYWVATRDFLDLITIENMVIKIIKVINLERIEIIP
ncbi:hypothetical protein AAG906_005971 [Vitis piasezkii]